MVTTDYRLRLYTAGTWFEIYCACWLASGFRRTSSGRTLRVSSRGDSRSEDYVSIFFFLPNF